MRHFVLLAALAGVSVHADDVVICYNYGCAEEARVVIDEPRLQEAAKLFADAGDAAKERRATAEALGYFARIAGEQTPTFRDKGGNTEDDGVDGRMDCIDHSQNATAYLELLASRGLLRFHRVLEPVNRHPLLVNEHWAARVEETATGEQFAVDSWFYDNGHPAVVFPLRDWLKGADPRG